MHVCDREHALEQKGCGHVYHYSLRILFPVILLIAFYIKTRNLQSKESRIQNPTYGTYTQTASTIIIILFSLSPMKESLGSMLKVDVLVCTYICIA